MAVYTTQVRTICEVEAGSTELHGYNDVDSILAQTWDKVIPGYPIFDESYRQTLNTKILRHYYTREIGLETVGLWKLKLQTKLNEIMPYYNQLYKSELLEFNPLYDVDLETTRNINGTDTHDMTDTENGTNNRTLGGTDTKNRTFNRTQGTTNNNTRTDTGTANSQGQYADTPQGKILSTDLTQNEYLTNATAGQDSHDNTVTDNGKEDVTIADTDNETVNYGKTDNDVISNTKKTNGTITNIEQYTEHVSGKKGGASNSKLLTEFRETFLNIDMMVINELEPLFMQLFGDVY